ncbi:MAG TPA: O-antigen ligase family protein [Solirubrobacterales bacterium]|nr:O-antigen ligase family protein [Solirubrobacterales bacterium]
MLLPLALVGGGFGLSDRHLAGLAVWLLVVGMLVLGAAGRALLARPFYWATGLIGALALLSALSSFWSGSIELSVTEADRVLVYLGVFIATFLIAQTGQRRQRFGEGLAIGLIAIAVIALASRLLPDLLSVSQGAEAGARLSYPLGYWNGDGVLFGIGMGLALWLSRSAAGPILRWTAVAALPAVLLALYFTYSRGGLLAAALACGCLIALSRDRLWLLATLAIGALGAVPAVLAVQGYNSLSENFDDSHIAAQGHKTLAILAAGSLLAALLFAALRRLERTRGRLTGRALAVSRNPRLLQGIALAAALLALFAALAVGGRAWDQFTSSDVAPPNTSAGHFTQLSSSGRNEFWRVAVDGFEEEPVLGSGAGTFRFSWYQLRHNSEPNTDAHSLYLQAFSELGLLGGLLVLALVGVLLWTGVSAWRHAQSPRRDLYAALLGACLAFAVCSAIDWFWQIAVIGAVFFMASGVLVAARCAQLAHLRATGNGRESRRGFGLPVVGLAVAWVSMLALVGPLLVDRELDASNAAAAEGNIPSAVSHAENARKIEPWATSPYKQLGLIAEREGNYPAAVERFDEAIDREEDNWLLYYLRARVEDRAGDEAAARADFAEAVRLNPEEKCLEDGFEGCG